MSQKFATISQAMPSSVKNSGIGPCPSAPAAAKKKFYQLAVTKAQKITAAAVSATARAAPEAHAANDGETNWRTQAPLGAIEKAFPKLTAEKADDVCATLFFAEQKSDGGRALQLHHKGVPPRPPH